MGKVIAHRRPTRMPRSGSSRRRCGCGRLREGRGGNHCDGGTLIANSARALLAASHTGWTLAVTEGSPARRRYERLGFAVDESLRGTPS